MKRRTHLRLRSKEMSQHDLVKLCEWPNGDWCLLEDVEEFGCDKSDDYDVLEITERQFFYEYTGQIRNAEDCI